MNQVTAWPDLTPQDCRSEFTLTADHVFAELALGREISMQLATKLLSMAVILALAGGSRANGHGRAHPPLREQEPPNWLKGFAIAALLLALSAFWLAAALL